MSSLTFLCTKKSFHVDLILLSSITLMGELSCVLNHWLQSVGGNSNDDINGDKKQTFGNTDE